MKKTTDIENKKLRQALRIWAHSDQLERYQFGIISDKLKAGLIWAAIGFVNGFIFGAVIVKTLGN